MYRGKGQTFSNLSLYESTLLFLYSKSLAFIYHKLESSQMPDLVLKMNDFSLA
jgi:hypothetical protein